MPIAKNAPFEEKRIAEILRSFPAIRAAYLFGSHASDSASELSDIDIALVLDEESPQRAQEEFGKMQLFLLAAFATKGFDSVDLVCLDDSNRVLEFEAVKHHRVLMHQEDFDHPSFFSKTVRKYFDFLPSIRLHEEAIKQRLIKLGTKHGS